jgi:dTDP-4-dehydrorhamnose reductase
MLGSDLARTVPPSVMLLEPPGERLDIREHARVALALRELRPDLVMNAAAYTAVDRAEGDEVTAMAVNGTAVGALGRACAELGIRVCHFSTDYVFAGDAGRAYSEDDATFPLGAYGRTKLAGERLLLESGAQALVVRTQWLFGRERRSFPRTMWERACRGQATRVVDDQHGCPTYAPDLASAVWSLVLGQLVRARTGSLCRGRG